MEQQTARIYLFTRGTDIMKTSCTLLIHNICISVRYFDQLTHLAIFMLFFNSWTDLSSLLRNKIPYVGKPGLPAENRCKHRDKPQFYVIPKSFSQRNTCNSWALTSWWPWWRWLLLHPPSVLPIWHNWTLALLERPWRKRREGVRRGTDREKERERSC